MELMLPLVPLTLLGKNFIVGMQNALNTVLEGKVPAPSPSCALGVVLKNTKQVGNLENVKGLF